MKILVVYYSRTGFTRRVAQGIAQACGADLEAIEDAPACCRRDGVLGYVRSALEAAWRLKASIGASTRAPGDYELVLIGTPIWFWNVSSPVRSYIEQHLGEFRRVGFFCTCGGSGQSRVLQDLERLSGKRAVASLALTDAEISGKKFSASLARFVARIKRVTGPGRKTRAA